MHHVRVPDSEWKSTLLQSMPRLIFVRTHLVEPFHVLFAQVIAVAIMATVRNDAHEPQYPSPFHPFLRTVDIEAVADGTPALGHHFHLRLHPNTTRKSAAVNCDPPSYCS